MSNKVRSIRKGNGTSAALIKGIPRSVIEFDNKNGFTFNAKVNTPDGELVPFVDAPSDGGDYVRRDEAWVTPSAPDVTPSTDDFEISLSSSTSSSQLNEMLNEIPSNLQGRRIVISMDAGTYTVLSQVNFTRFINGNIIIQRNTFGSPVVTIDNGINIGGARVNVLFNRVNFRNGTISLGLGFNNIEGYNAHFLVCNFIGSSTTTPRVFINNSGFGKISIRGGILTGHPTHETTLIQGPNTNLETSRPFTTVIISNVSQGSNPITNGLTNDGVLITKGTVSAITNLTTGGALRMSTL